ncbi:MAG: hypothetical protein V5B32_06305, partial [Candidatus Accumulibacter sp. UW26]
LFVAREQGNDRRVGYAPVIAGSNRVADRRRTASTLIYSLERGQRTLARKGAEFELSAPPPCT